MRRIKTLLKKSTSLMLVFSMLLSMSGLAFATGDGNHDHWDVEYVDPTCEENGYYVYSCGDDASLTYIVEVDATALGHDYVVTGHEDATCTENGKEIHTCQRCNDTYSVNDDTAPALGHQLVHATGKDATCEEEGYTDYSYCINDDCTYTVGFDVIPALGHKYVENVTKEPTCTEKGELTYICENDASHTYKVELDALGHNYVLDESKTKEPTCTEKGELTYICENDASHTKTEEIPALGHIDENNDEVCDRCGENLGAEHVHTETVIPGKAATCTEKGLTDGVKCSECGEILVEQEEIPALGHIDEDEDYICDREGCEEHVHHYVLEWGVPACDPNGGFEYWVCYGCWEGYEVQLEKEPHPGCEYVEQRDPTCTEYGTEGHYVCTECGAYVNEDLSDAGYPESIEPLGHTNDVEGDEDGVCDRCGYTHLVLSVETETEIAHFGEIVTYTVYLNGANTVAQGVTGGAFWLQLSTNCELVEDSFQALTDSGLNIEVDPETMGVAMAGTTGCTAEKVALVTFDVRVTYTRLGTGSVVVPYSDDVCLNVGIEDAAIDLSLNDGQFEIDTRTNGRFTIHPIDTKLSYDENGHWYACTRDDDRDGIVDCDAKAAYSEHEYEYATETEPTCTKNGLEIGTCVCGHTVEREIPALGHNYVETGRTDATCTEAGTIIYTCDRCGDSYSEEDAENPALGHIDEDENGACDRCFLTELTLSVEADKEFASAGDVITYTVYLNNNKLTGGVLGGRFWLTIPEGLTLVEGSFAALTDSGLTIELDEDLMGVAMAGAAGCEAERVALVTFQCVMNENLTDGEILTVDFVEDVETCLNGAEEDYYLTDGNFTVTGGEISVHCHVYEGKWIYNDDGHWQLCACGHVGESVDHEIVVTTIPATCYENGLEIYECLVCEYSYEKVIDAHHAHGNKGDECDECGYVFGAFDDVSLSVESDFDTAMPGETARFTVYLNGANTVAGGVWGGVFFLNLPEGMTLVEGSFVGMGDADHLVVTAEGSMGVSMAGSSAWTEEKVALAAFSVVIDENMAIGEELTVAFVDNHDTYLEGETHAYFYCHETFELISETITTSEVPAAFKVTYDANGGAGDMGITFVKNGSEYTLPECGFTAPEGMKFKAWDVNGTEMAAGAVITVTEDVTIKAVWEKIPVAVKEYTITFAANGGTGTMAKVTVKENAKFTLPACTFTAPSGMEFYAWDVNGTKYAVGAEITVTADTVVKALWQSKSVDIKMYNITFAANGGTGTMAIVAVQENTKYTLPACTFTAPSGMQFKAWDVNGTQYAVGKEITVTGNITVKAIWEKIPVKEYTVKFDANGGTGTMADVTVKADANTYTLPECGFTAAKGMRFKAWNVNGELYAAGDKITVTGNVTIKAEWLLIGDVNNDGKVNGTDTNLIFRAVSRTLTLTADQMLAADANGDGKVNGTDTNLVFRFVSKTLASLG